MAKYPQIKVKIVKRGFGLEKDEDVPKALLPNNPLMIRGVEGFRAWRIQSRRASTTCAFDGFVEGTKYAEAYEFDPEAGNGVGYVVLKKDYEIVNGVPRKKAIAETSTTAKKKTSTKD